MLHIDDLPDEIIALLDPVDLACMADHGMLDPGVIQHLYQELGEIAISIPDPTPTSITELVLRAVRSEPGIWIARLCRQLNGLAETEDSVIYCGLCAEYANPRKRARARHYASIPTLPGMVAPFQLHAPCPRVGLARLKHTVYRLEQRGLLRRQRGKIPDSRNYRGWDWASRLYPL